MLELRHGATAQLDVHERVCRMILILTCCASPLPPTQTCVRVRLAFLLCETQRLRPRGPTDVARDPQNNPTRAPWAGSGIDYLARTHVRASPYLTVREKLHWGPPLVPKREGQVLVVEQGGSRTGRLRLSV